MQKIDFKNFPDTSTPLSAANLNQLQTNVENAFADVWKIVYPVGSIYISVNPNSPETLFGGRWEKLKDTFLLGQGDTYTTVGATGGDTSHTHTMAHTHTMSHSHGLGDAGWAKINPSAGSSYLYCRIIGVGDWGENARMQTSNVAITSGLGSSARAIALGGSTNGSSAANTGAASNSTTSSGSNLPPYTVVYMWKRLEDNA